MLTLLPDLNVAPLKYAHIHREHGGPVHSLSYAEKQLPEGKFFEAYVFLDEKNTGLKGLSFGPHGHALAPEKAEAIHAAISNALEQWAWLATSSNASLKSTLRFDVDPTPHGFAAFPGLGVQGARKRALFEAAEKWNVCAWWEGKLTHAALKTPNTIQLQSPIVGVSTVITWSEAPALYGIGTAAAPSLALARARFSLLRNREALAQDKDSPRKRRLIHFSRAEGVQAFRQRLNEAGQRSAAPQALVDAAVPGPWHQYAHVWRCLFDCGAFREKDRDDYFYF